MSTVLPVQDREKARGRAVRRAGYVPVILYGRGFEPLKLKVKSEDLSRILARTGRHGLIDLRVTSGRGNGDCKAVIKEIQTDFTGRALHADFCRVTMDKPMKSAVPIRLRGLEEAVRRGWTVEHQLNVVDVECLPGELPETIEGDLTGIKPGEYVTVADLHTPHGVTVLNDPEAIVAVVDKAGRADAAPDTGRGMPELAEAKQGRE